MAAKPIFNESKHRRDRNGKFSRKLSGEPSVSLEGTNSGAKVSRNGQEVGTITPTSSGRFKTSNTGDREFTNADNAAIMAAFSRPPAASTPSRGSQRSTPAAPSAPAPSASGGSAPATRGSQRATPEEGAKKDRPKTFSVVGPNGEVFTRTSPRPYTHARVLDFGENQPPGQRFSATFHSSAALAAKPHSDFPRTKFTVHKASVGALATEQVDADGNPAPDGVTVMGTARKPLGPAGLQALKRARGGGRPRDRADVRQRADLRARGLLDRNDKITPAGRELLG